MKTIKLILFAALFVLISNSCGDEGTASVSLSNSEQLPPELKGLKVYTVWTSNMSTVQVAVLNNQVNSVTYQEGKTTETTIIINPQTTGRVVQGDIISETDDIIVIRKK